MNRLKTLRLNRILALVLTIVALLTGQNAWAWDGEGTSASPWLIKTTGDLVTLATNSKTNTYYQKFFRLENDLDMNGIEIETIGNNDAFFGATFDGNGHAIRNVTISKPNDNRVGIFGRTQSACTIRNLIIDQASITGYTYVGVLVGETSTEGGNIENCFVINSSVTSNYTSDTYAGIISGNYWSNVNYSGNCYYNCSRTIGSGEPATTNIATRLGDKPGAAIAAIVPDGWGPISGDGITYNGTLYCAEGAALGPVTWATLQTALSNASTDADNPTVITLAADITAEASDTYLNLEGGRKVILDLNGHTLDRHLTEAKTNNLNYGSIGCVIRVSSSNTSLTIRDSGTNGTITGGWSTSGAGCINAINGATLRIEGGTITGNRVQGQGGAIYLSGNFYMTGGTITGNAANLVNNNNIRTGSAIFFGSSGDFYMTGGSITGNYCGTTGYGAAGIGCYNASYTFNVHLSGTYDIGGNQQGTYDSSNGTWSNLSPSDILNHDHMTYVIDGAISPSQTARMIVDAHDSKATITSGWSTYMSGEAPEDYFTLDPASGLGFGFNANGEVTIGTLHTITLADGLTASATQAAPGRPITLSGASAPTTTGGITYTTDYIISYNDDEAHADHYAADANGQATFPMPDANVSVSSETVASVAYIDANGNTAYSKDFTVLTSTTDLSPYASDKANTSARWFVVKDADVSLGKFEIYGITNIILCDGADVTFTNTGSDWTIYHGGTLNIYGQDGGTGRLTATNTSYYDGIFVTALGGTSLIIPGNLNIYGGQITATTASSPGYGIEVKGTATLGWTRASNRIYANSYEGTIKIADGQLFTDGSGNNFFGTITDVSTIAGKTLQPAVTVAMNANGIRTYASPYALDMSAVDAYVISDYDNTNSTLTLTNVTEAPANTGLLLKAKDDSQKGTDIVLPLKANAAAIASNLLKPVLSSETIVPQTDGLYTNFILANGNYGIDWYTLSEAGAIGANKAYLQLLTSELSGLSRGFTWEYEGGTTGIDGRCKMSDGRKATGRRTEFGNCMMSDVWYDLSGRKLSGKPTRKGVYIYNGKKVKM